MLTAYPAVERIIKGLGLMLTSKSIARFEQKFIPEPNSGCWLWTAHVNRNGYGYFHVRPEEKMQRGPMQAHRVSWAIYRGPIPVGVSVLHKCDNGVCVNPDHLFLGTHIDNMADMDKKGRRRSASGEAHGKAKLNEYSVRLIKDDPRTSRQIAAEYNVSYQSINDIRAGRHWRSVQC